MFRDRDVIRVSDASEALGVGRSTAHRILAMLQFHGLIEQDPETRAYRTGPALVDLGLSAVRDLDIRSHLRPHMERLCREVGETVQLMVLQGAETVFIEGVESDRPLRTASRVGVRLPAHATSGGKALLAELPEGRLRDLYPSPRLEALTPRSTTSRSALEAELGRIRDRGYAVNLGESEPDIGAVGAAVRSSFGRARAALAVSAPLTRIEHRIDEVADALKSCARDASAGLS
jgi:DNA-binding IclR family transcriptional regulator